MIFLIPLLIIIALIFGIDYLYFKDENIAIKEQKKNEVQVEQKFEEKEKNSTK
ncbi:hypothetical protein OQH60_03825 [Campylobacter sp. MIT 21-1685]|uniref:hypothetical protein n=1 Tax=unclassified Campylobacter TaxID=2593542 RepID=UPI00224B0B14|nr:MULTISPECIES: hypothetical protein [unclassified Campylobacter]MCX2682989.1 hypothetical protein [Campylobacter sp. MIT 21-1684]MCX2751271.1 hypothetical protein [Campylobacter sp. MIT 21-1682]MCX2807470.1 hypothetical protein [Campylobacter sp. MIT 21-1685]